MDAPFVRTLLGVTLLALAYPQDSDAARPVFKTPRTTVRSYPTEEELIAFLKPISPGSIPDDPPPHEGAMIDIPYFIEPSDLLLVEVLEALPGRPITGERLVQPDGTISLGFYGSVHVSGLTPEQAKVKILLHLRTFLDDDRLGLYTPMFDEDGEPVIDESENEPASPPARVDDSEPLPDPPPAAGNGRSNPQKSGEAASSGRKAKRSRPRSRQRGPKRPGSGRPSPLAAPKGENEPNPSGESRAIDSEPLSTPSKPAESRLKDLLRWVSVHPADSDRIFVDVVAFNTKVYYVLGDVAAAGRMPVTGHETVLDALNFAGGFIATANPRDVRLIRPARGSKPARTYPVDYEAITLKGDSTANYQLFPGDRVVIGRNDVVKKTIALDRLSAPLQTIVHTIMQYNFMVGSLKHLGTSTTGTGTGTTTLTEAQREAVVKVWAEFWGKAMAETDGVTFDEKRLHEALLRALEPAAKGADESKPK